MLLRPAFNRGSFIYPLLQNVYFWCILLNDIPYRIVIGETVMAKEEDLYAYAIPENVLESKRILSFRRRNWIEGLICAGIVGFIIFEIPFVVRVKLIFLVILCGSVLMLNLIGIRDQSIIEAISNIRTARQNSGEYHLRRPTDEERFKTGRVAKSFSGTANGDSAADKLYDLAKEKIKQLKGNDKGLV